MAQIRISIIDQIGATKTTVEVPDDVPMNQLIPALVEALNLPARQGGNPISYRLDRPQDGRRLGNEETLSSVGIEPGEIFSLSPEVMAGCFLPGTMVTLPGGKYLPIEGINSGDQVLSYDTESKELCTGIVSDVYIGESDKHLLINDKLRVTETHLFFCDGKWVQAKHLTKGNHLRTENGESLLVDSIETKLAKTIVYNLHLATRTHTFFAEKILVHNLLEKLSVVEKEAHKLYSPERKEVAGPNEISLSPENIERLAEIISSKIEARLLVKLVEVTELSKDEKKLIKGTMLVRPSFGIPSDLPQYKSDVFMIMPFKDEFETIYRHFIVRIVQSLNLSIKRGDDFFSAHNTSIIDEVWSAIYFSKFVIADCTGRNPNVFYEIGIAHVLGKPTILITQTIDDVPFDVQNRRLITYQNNAAGLLELETKLNKNIQILLNEENSNNI